MSNSWIGAKVRKDEREGVVINDSNGLFRILMVRMDDGGFNEQITMNNVGDDPKETHEWEWLCDNFHGGEKGSETRWLRF